MERLFSSIFSFCSLFFWNPFGTMQNRLVSNVKSRVPFGIMLNLLAPKPLLCPTYYTTTFGTMPNRLVPKPTRYSTCFPFPFGTMSNQLVPKPLLCPTHYTKTFGTMSNKLVPKLQRFQVHNCSTFGTMSNKLAPKQGVYQRFVLWSFGTMSNKLVPKPRVDEFFRTSPSINKVGDTIPIVARKLLRTMKSSLHCLPESRINTSHLSAQSEQPPN